MIFGCGIDIEEINRFYKHYFNQSILSNLVYDIFTSKEIENFSVFGREAFLKGFCFKEAFYKSLTGYHIGFSDVEIIFKNEKEFDISYSKAVREIFKEENITDVNASFQINDHYAIFKVLLIQE